MTKKQYAEQVAAYGYEHGMKFLEGLDPQISTVVNLLRSQGVETCQSCQGGDEHSYPEPTVEFFGNECAGWRALAVALAYAMPVFHLRREWTIEAGVPVGPLWAMTFMKSKLDAFNASW